MSTTSKDHDYSEVWGHKKSNGSAQQNELRNDRSARKHACNVKARTNHVQNMYNFNVVPVLKLKFDMHPTTGRFLHNLAFLRYGALDANCFGLQMEYRNKLRENLNRWNVSVKLFLLKCKLSCIYKALYCSFIVQLGHIWSLTKRPFPPFWSVTNCFHQLISLVHLRNSNCLLIWHIWEKLGCRGWIMV